MRLRTKALMAAAAAAVLIGGVAGMTGYALAQEGGNPTPAATSSARQAFIDRLAANLNVTPDQLKQAVKTTELQTVDDVLSQGKITQNQADTLKARINSGSGTGFGQLLRPCIRAAVARRQIVSSAATAIGIDPGSLRSELHGGKSIADIAGEHNVSVDTVKSQITADVQAKLDGLVQRGTITRARADAAMAKLAANLDRILNAKKQ